jgi:cytochrome P450
MTTTQPGSAVASDILNMNDSELMQDPFGGYARIREQTPVVRAVMRGVDPVWLVTRYDDVTMVLGDPRFVVDPRNVPGMRVESVNAQIQRAGGAPPEYVKYRMATMDEADGDNHTRLRVPAASAYTSHRIAQLRPHMEETTEKLLDRLPEVAEDGVVDLISHYTYPLSGAMLAAAAGIPSEDRARWQEWYMNVHSKRPEKRAETWRSVVPYLKELLEIRSAELSSDGENERDELISTLIRYRVPCEDDCRPGSGDNAIRLNDTEIISMTLVLGLTSQGAAHMLGDSILALLTHPDQFELLLENPDLLPQAVHELARWTTPTRMAPHVRYATEDIEIHSTLIRKGEAVAAMLATANRDPRKFADPDRLDITRTPGRRAESHVTFGTGTHFCIGSAVTNMEAELAFGGLLRRYPGISLAVPEDELEYESLPIPFQTLLTTLPVRL